MGSEQRHGMRWIRANAGKRSGSFDPGHCCAVSSGRRRGVAAPGAATLTKGAGSERTFDVFPHLCRLGGEVTHLSIEVGFAFKADAWQIGHGDVARLHPHPVRETTIGLEQVGVALVAAETEASRDVQ